MKLTYDQKHNIAYIYLRDAIEEVDTIRVSDELNVDIAPDATVYGIELLNANAQLAAAGGRTFELENSETGAHIEVELPDSAA
jgi:uncharacterized protein YuzE